VRPQLEDMFPLTLGANIGTTLTGIMAASVVNSDPVSAWQERPERQYPPRYLHM
jgi:hypothetical protein